VYCVWQVVKTPTIISNNPVYACRFWQSSGFIEPSCRFQSNWQHVATINEFPISDSWLLVDYTASCPGCIRQEEIRTRHFPNTTPQRCLYTQPFAFYKTKKGLSCKLRSSHRSTYRNIIFTVSLFLSHFPPSLLQVLCCYMCGWVEEPGWPTQGFEAAIISPRLANCWTALGMPERRACGQIQIKIFHKETQN